MSNVIEVAGSPIERKDRPPALVSTSDATPMQMVAIAVQQGADLAKIEKLMDLQARWEADRARKAFVAAMAAFKAEPLSIIKSKKVNIPGGAAFAHATLADVVDGVVASLSKHGLSHKWELQQDGDRISVTCVLTHEAGHSERTTLSGLPDDSGRKNGIQQIASTVTYLERYTLMAICGLSAKDMDDDGRGAGSPKPKVSPEQVANLKALLTEVGANEINFLKWARAETLGDILASNYDACVKAIEAKRHG
jgi:ERF superfamily